MGNLLNLLSRGGRQRSAAPINPYPEVGSITAIGESGVEFGADDLYRILVHDNPRSFEPVIAEKGSKITVIPGYAGRLLLRTHELTWGKVRPSHAEALQTVRAHYKELNYLQQCAGRRILPNFVSLLVGQDPHNNGGITQYIAVERSGNGRTLEECQNAKPGSRKYAQLIRTADTLSSYYEYRPGTDPYANPFPARSCIDELADLCQWSREGKLYDLDPDVCTGDTSFNVRYNCLGTTALWVSQIHPSEQQEAILQGLEEKTRFVRQFAYR